MTFFPKIVEIKSAVIKAAADLKEIYPNNDAPVNWYCCSKYSNR